MWRDTLFDLVVALRGYRVGKTVSKHTSHIKLGKDARPAQPRYNM